MKNGPELSKGEKKLMLLSPATMLGLRMTGNIICYSREITQGYNLKWLSHDMRK